MNRARKKILVLLTVGIMVVLSGCGLAEKNRKAEIEAEIKGVEAEIASWSDDMVIEITDPFLLDTVRGIIGKESGDITYGDVKNITSVESFYSSNYADISSIKYFTSLTKFYATVENETNLDCLKYCRKLETLILCGKGITDISPLSKVTSLKYLHLGMEMYDEPTLVTDISPLSNLTELEGLTLFGDGITDISVLSNLTKMTYLSINGEGFTDISVLGGLTNLEEVYLIGDGITDISVLGKFTNMPNLEMLCISTDKITDISVFGKLEYLPEFNELIISGDGITDISVLGKLTNLEYLTIQGAGITDVSSLANLKKLKELELYGEGITDISALDSLTNTEIRR